MLADLRVGSEWIVLDDDGATVTLVPAEEYEADRRARLEKAPPVIRQLAAALAKGGGSDA